MGIKNWSNSRSHSIELGRARSQRGIRLGLRGDDCDSKWKELWRKIKREKHKLFHANTCNNTISNGQYDPDTYSRNFDEGLGCVEPENLSRSFSARYADPSRVRARRSE